MKSSFDFWTAKVHNFLFVDLQSDKNKFQEVDFVWVSELAWLPIRFALISYLFNAMFVGLASTPCSRLYLGDTKTGTHALQACWIFWDYNATFKI